MRVGVSDASEKIWDGRYSLRMRSVSRFAMLSCSSCCADGIDSSAMSPMALYLRWMIRLGLLMSSDCDLLGAIQVVNMSLSGSLACLHSVDVARFAWT